MIVYNLPCSRCKQVDITALFPTVDGQEKRYCPGCYAASISISDRIMSAKIIRQAMNQQAMLIAESNVPEILTKHK
jgi:uncharacterized paraquat-inducible protein A